jgi:lipopolysaccharide export system protein LptA
MKRYFFFLPVLLLLTANCLWAQSDTTQPVIILKSDNLYWKKIDANTEVEILSGKVQLRQGNTLFYCDSCIVNNSANLFEAFGHVEIHDDTTHVYSDYLRYLTDKKLAYLNGRVRLTDGKATLTTSNLEYDVNNKIGTYKNGGRLLNKKSVLTSTEGVYYTELKDIYFKNKVELKDPAYYLKTDSLLYNTESQVARFIADTYIRDSNNRVIRTREGFYDMAKNHAEFISRTNIEDGSLNATADRIASDDESGIIQLQGNAVVRDTAKGQTIIAGEIFMDKKRDATLATIKPLMIIRQDNDSIYVTADTLFTARLTELYKNDSVMLKKLNLEEKDSTNRYFEAYRNVRVFSDSLQAISDSAYYSFKDSTFHLFQDPVVWNKSNQITGDTIYVFTKNKKAERIKVFENSFIINELDPGVYNQVRANRIDGYLKEGTLDSVWAKGAAESVYFIQDNDSAYTSVNQTKSDAITMEFEKGDLYKVVFISELKGTLFPISQKNPSDMHLSQFRWLQDRRPKTKYELFE